MNLNQFYKYFKANGLFTGVKQMIRRLAGIVGFSNSETLFLSCNTEDVAYNKSNQQASNIEVEMLSNERKEEFKKIKYYPFLNEDELLNSMNKGVLLAIINNKITGYLVAHKSEMHTIFNLGKWSLSNDEAWIGPVYILPEWRNKKIFSHLLFEGITFNKKNNIKRIYTCINSENIASIKTFCNLGFNVVGRVRIQKVFYRKTTSVLNFSSGKFINSKFTI